MHDSFDDAFLAENTHIHRPQPLVVTAKTDTELAYYVLAEDMDRADQVRVYEGLIRAARLEEVPKDDIRKLILSGFGGDSWKYEDIEIPFRLFKMRLKLVKLDVNNHSTVIGLQRAIDHVMRHVQKLEQEALIISTLNDRWERALIRSVLQQIKPDLGGPYD